MKSGKLFIRCVIKKVYNGIIKSIQIQKIDAIFMNSENSKSSEHVLILNLTKRKLLYQTLVFITWKNIKSLYKNNNFKI